MDNNGVSYNYNGYHQHIEKIEEMSEERKAYLLEKEEMIRKKRKNKKTFSLIILFVIVFGISFYLYKNYFRPVKIDERIDKNSIHYVTDLYYSDGRYYEEYLDEKEKKFYLAVFNDLKDVKKTSEIDCRDFGYSDDIGCVSSVNKIIDVVLMEHPDLFWYRSSSGKYQSGYGITLNHHYVSTNKLQLYFVEKRLLRKIDEITSEYEDLSDYEKIKSVYTWLGANKSYSDIMTRKDGTAWSALLDNDTVCAGYAAASQLLFQRLNIESALVSGYTTSAHAWNFVYLEDGYYWYDATVGGSYGEDSPYFYNGLLFANTGDYTVGSVDINKYKFGTKYLES